MYSEKTFHDFYGTFLGLSKSLFRTRNVPECFSDSSGSKKWNNFSKTVFYDSFQQPQYFLELFNKKVDRTDQEFFWDHNVNS